MKIGTIVKWEEFNEIYVYLGQTHKNIEYAGLNYKYMFYPLCSSGKKAFPNICYASEYDLKSVTTILKVL